MVSGSPESEDDDVDFDVYDMTGHLSTVRDDEGFMLEVGGRR